MSVTTRIQTAAISDTGTQRDNNEDRVLHDPERGSYRAVMGATETVPIVFDDAAGLFRNGHRTGFARDLDPGVAEERLLTAGMSDAIDRKLHVTALKRALERAAQP